MMPPRAMLIGLGRAVGSPRLLLWLWLVNLLAALPAAVWVGDTIRRAVGPSVVEENLRAGFDVGWWGEFQHRASGVESTFTPTHSGPGAFFANLEAWLTGDLFLEPPALVAMGIGYALLWAVLLGGVLDHLVRPSRSTTLDRFLAASGRYGFRLIRLAALTAGLYYGVYLLARRLFPWLERTTRDVTVEKTVLAYYLAGAAAIAVLLVAIRVLSDYAKIALVAEERRSSLLALAAGLRFVIVHPVRTFGTALLFALLAALLLAAYALVAPGAEQSAWVPLFGAVLLGQAFLVAKLVVRIGFLAAEVAVYRQPSRRTLPRAF